MKTDSFVRKTTEFSRQLPVGIAKKLVVFHEIGSTNSTAKELAFAGAEEGTVVIAQTQHQGRGRFDRHWESPEGGVYLSLILRPKVQAVNTSLLPLLTALAVSRTIATYDLHPIIKWPNDMLVNRKKIAGILLESEVEGSKVLFVVVGIGVNLNINLDDLSQEIRAYSTSLKNETGVSVDYLEFLNRFFLQFHHYYQLFLDGQYNDIIREWKQHSDTLGKTVEIKASGTMLRGTAFDIDQFGFLLVKTTDGSIKKITSGDCIYLNQL